MRTSNLVKLASLLLLGCSAEHTIADESTTDQSMTVVARPICVDMCNHELTCGEITDNELAGCLTQCERDCIDLYAHDPVGINRETLEVITADQFIQQTAACYLASACGATPPSNCHPTALTTLAAGVAPRNPKTAGSSGLTNCGMQQNQLSCESEISQGIEPHLTWSLTCSRASTAATEWTCQCFEYGVQVSEQSGTPAEDDVSMAGLCWSKQQLSCFYGNGSSC